MSESKMIKIKEDFRINEWIDNMKRPVVNDKDQLVDLTKLTIDEIIKLNDAGKLFFIKEVPERSLMLAKIADVSDEAKLFHKYESEHTKKEVLKCAHWFMDLVGYFHHYAFFTKQLWKKIKGFKNADEAEITIHFIQWWFRYKYGWQDYPCGMSWSRIKPTTYEDEDRIYEDHIEELRPLFEEFDKWCERQR